MNIGLQKILTPVAAIVMAMCGAGYVADASAMTSQDASRLLAQGTYGPTQADLDTAVSLTAAQWIDQQIAKPISSHQSTCQSLKNSSGKVDRDSRTAAWWQISLKGQDQLRQRVALALSEIFVVSDQNATLVNDGAYEALCQYYDILSRNAFGSYRTLLNDVTLSVPMGIYLSMFGNLKPNTTTGVRSDENYAREVMQLFTVGLWQLNSDGSPKLDSYGNPIPTYTQAHIEATARAFTGWYFDNPTYTNTPQQWLKPMKAFDTWHDTAAKTIIGGVTIPAGTTAAQDLATVLDTLFKHPNVGPFIGRQLIQKLVTANPSPAYVARVAAVFANDGNGVRGNLGAVVRAILLDAEARNGVAANPDFGKPRENIVRQASLWRLLDAKPLTSDGRYQYKAYNALFELGQSALSAGSVFNFFQPGYAPVGELRDAGMKAPEYQLSTEPGVTLAYNLIFKSLYFNYAGRSGVSSTEILVDYTKLLTVATNTDALLDKINILMLGGQMPSEFRTTMRDYLNLIPTSSDGGRSRLQDALYMTFTSPQYQIQR